MGVAEVSFDSFSFFVILTLFHYQIWSIGLSFTPFFRDVVYYPLSYNRICLQIVWFPKGLVRASRSCLNGIIRLYCSLHK